MKWVHTRDEWVHAHLPCAKKPAVVLQGWVSVIHTAPFSKGLLKLWPPFLSGLQNSLGKSLKKRAMHCKKVGERPLTPYRGREFLTCSQGQPQVSPPGGWCPHPPSPVSKCAGCYSFPPLSPSLLCILECQVSRTCINFPALSFSCQTQCDNPRTKSTSEWVLTLHLSKLKPVPSTIQIASGDQKCWELRADLGRMLLTSPLLLKSTGDTHCEQFVFILGLGRGFSLPF